MLDKIKVQIDDGAYPPERAHREDAGMDIRTPVGVTVWPGETEFVDTHVHVEIPEGCAGLLVSKSGLNRRGITTTGLIDAGYTGSIGVTLVNNTGVKKIFRAGDKITQLVIIPVETPEIEIVEKISGGERGNSGFGSTGR